jgi:hypothetical protein
LANIPQHERICRFLSGSHWKWISFAFCVQTFSNHALRNKYVPSYYTVDPSEMIGMLSYCKSQKIWIELEFIFKWSIEFSPCRIIHVCINCSNNIRFTIDFNKSFLICIWEMIGMLSYCNVMLYRNLCYFIKTIMGVLDVM